MAKQDSEPRPQDIYRLAKESRKNLNDFIVDLFGSLVPGIIFLFSVLLCLVIPLTMLILNSTHIHNEELIKLIIGIFENWFWVISFLTFLILAYAVGSIFYRLDIKKVDRKSFGYMAKKHFKEDVFPKVKPYFKKRHFLIRIMNKGKYIRYNKKKIRYNEKEITKIYDFIKSYIELISTQFSVYEMIKEEEIIKSKLYNEELLKSINEKEKIIYKLHKEELLKSISKEEKEEKINKLNEEIDILSKKIIAINIDEYHLFTKKLNDIIKKATEFEKNVDEPKALLEEFEKNGNALLEEINNFAYELYEKRDANSGKSTDKQRAIIEDYLSPFLKLRKNAGEEERQMTLALGWYYLISLRLEFACDKKENCQFPYTYYAEYLLKRDAKDLAKHVIWKDKRSRSKNGLNRLKFKIQLAAPKEYNILVKNEAHIRMASSSWSVAKAMFLIGFLSIIILVSFIIAEYVTQKKIDYINTMYLLLLPLAVLAFNLFIYVKVKQFMHYQRLREIFTTVLTYNYLFEEGIHKWYEQMSCSFLEKAKK